MSTLLSRPVLRTAALVIGLGLLVAWASLELRIHTRLDTIHDMSNILHGRPMQFGSDIRRRPQRSLTGSINLEATGSRLIMRA